MLTYIMSHYRFKLLVGFLLAGFLLMLILHQGILPFSISSREKPSLPWQIFTYGALHRWKFVPVNEKARPENSEFIWGDFEGNGRRGYVVGEVHGGLMRVVETCTAFLPRGFGYKPFFIAGTFTPPLEETIIVAPKGSSFVEQYSKKIVRCENDCIKIGNGKLFKFENDRFREFAIE